MGCYYLYCLCQEARLSLTEEKIQRGIKERKLDELHKQDIQARIYDVIEIYECDWRNMYKTDNIGKEHLRESFHYKMLIREERLFENIKSGSLFGYVHCDIEVPENLQESFANFPPIVKNINVGRDGNGSFMKEYADKEGILTQPRKMLTSSFFVENGTIITPFLLFIWTLGLLCFVLVKLEHINCKSSTYGSLSKMPLEITQDCLVYDVELILYLP